MKTTKIVLRDYSFFLIAAFFAIAMSAVEAYAVPNAGVKVITVVDNGNSPTPKSPADFQFTIAETGQLPLFSFAGSAQGITIPLTASAPTTFVFSRITALANYARTFSGDCNADGTIGVEVFATDDFGNQQGFDRVGTVRVIPKQGDDDDDDDDKGAGRPFSGISP